MRLGCELLSLTPRQAEPLLDDVCSVLAVSAFDHDAAFRFPGDLAKDETAAPSVCGHALCGLAFHPTNARVEQLMRKLSEREQDPALRDVITSSLALSDDAESVRLLVACLRVPEPVDADRDAWTVSELSHVRVSEPGAVAEVLGLVEEALDRRSDDGTARVLLGAALNLYRSRGLPRHLDRVLRHLDAPCLPAEVRTDLLESIVPLPNDVARVREYRMGVALRESEDRAVRRAAIRGWTATIRAADVEWAQQKLSELLSTALENALRDEVETGIVRLREAHALAR